MKLFCAAGSSSLLPHIVLLEAGLPFTAILIDEHTKAIEGGGDYRAPRVEVDLSPYPNVRTHHARIGARPTVQAAIMAEGPVPH